MDNPYELDEPNNLEHHSTTTLSSTSTKPTSSALSGTDNVTSGAANEEAEEMRSHDEGANNLSESFFAFYKM